MTRQDTLSKKYVRIRFRGETLIRLSTIKFAKHYNLTSTLDLVHGARRVPRETRATKACVFFGSPQRSKHGE